MQKFHINDKELPAKCTSSSCKRKDHFESEEEAQKYIDDINKENHGLVPELNFKYVRGVYKSDKYRVNYDVEKKLKRIINDVNLEEVIESLFEEFHYFFFTYKTSRYLDKELDMFAKVSREDDGEFLIEIFIEGYERNYSAESNLEKSELTSRESDSWCSSQFTFNLKELADEMIENKSFYDTESPYKSTGALLNSLFTMALSEAELKKQSY